MNEIKMQDKKKYFKWLEKCLACWKACEQCISESLNTGKYLSVCNLCRDCAEMCATCIKFEAQRSAFFENLCQVSADICMACAKECDKYADESITFKNCVEACRVCARLSLEIAAGNNTVEKNN